MISEFANSSSIDFYPCFTIGLTIEILHKSRKQFSISFISNSDERETMKS